ncbi:MAG: hypothetical protein M1821_001037 [Bathelium mastoideum]|nr:MAG: hypothetical protein M1821_001037 [Bathelium mastoideum]KAI9693938.1 MAG: hypothetical protein M1822_003209 [Bathelium mastoideum]
MDTENARVHGKSSDVGAKMVKMRVGFNLDLAQAEFSERQIRGATILPSHVGGYCFKRYEHADQVGKVYLALATNAGGKHSPSPAGASSQAEPASMP